MKLGLNNEIGNLVAILIIATFVFYKGFMYQDLLLGILGLLLFIYEGYRICKLHQKSPKNKDIKLSKIEKPISENIILEIRDK